MPSNLFDTAAWQAAIDSLPAGRQNEIVDRFSAAYRDLAHIIAAQLDDGSLVARPGQTWNHLIAGEFGDEHAIRLRCGDDTAPLWKVAFDQALLNASNDDLAE